MGKRSDQGFPFAIPSASFGCILFESKEIKLENDIQDEKAMIRNRYNRIPHPVPDT